MGDIMGGGATNMRIYDQDIVRAHAGTKPSSLAAKDIGHKRMPFKQQKGIRMHEPDRRGFDRVIYWSPRNLDYLEGSYGTTYESKNQNSTALEAEFRNRMGRNIRRCS